MSEGKRPGGLTALAVLNFIFAFFGVMSILGMIVLFALFNVIADSNMDEQSRKQFDAVQEMGMPMLVVMVTMSVFSTILLLLSGIGYIKQKRFLGRILGSVYAFVSIISSVMSGIMMKPEAGGGFNIGTIIGLLYPLITLILVNTTFKDDLVN